MPNRLASSRSPYLLQHAGNPVDWLEWGEEAFAKAREEEKPIFLSIGYSTCHWCHVMAHESFENPEIAALLNGHFVPVKVDREERPDVDRIYMTYVQSLTGAGGWPLSAWLTPELQPFFGGTYFPPEDRHGRPGFPRVLEAIARSWRENREKVIDQAQQAVSALRDHPQGRGTGDDGAPLGDAAAEAFEKGARFFMEFFDERNGGFGGAPKFPRPAVLNFLVRAAVLQGAGTEFGQAVVRMADVTLRKMALGGMHDHVGGGFHRYAVDAEWFVPHFEKMLYDQAQLAASYLDLRQVTGDERHAWLARDIFDYVRRDLTHPDGGFFSAEDADSVPPEAAAAGGKPHPVEGAFYVWTKAEIDAVLGADAELFCSHYGVEAAGNVAAERDPFGEFRGKNILAQQRPLVATAAARGLELAAANERLRAALEKLRAVRAGRPRPQRDDKVLAAWNGLMISALARGHQVLGDPACLAAAVGAAEFLERELYDAERGVLFRSWRQGRGAVGGFAEDYACVVRGLLDLYEAGFDVRWLQWARRLQETMDGLFWDEAEGGYFDARADDARLVLRLKEDYDGAEPAASSVAAENLLRLAAMLGDHALRERGRRTLGAFRRLWEAAPQALPQMLCALELALEAPRTVVLAGDPAAADFKALAAVLHERAGPRRSLLCADGGEGQRWLAAHAPWLAEIRPVAGRAAAYVCEESTCQAPVTEPGELRRRLA